MVVFKILIYVLKVQVCTSQKKKILIYMILGQIIEYARVDLYLDMHICNVL